MEGPVPVQDLVVKLLTTRSCTREEFKRIYKLLCKNTHPDLTGKDGSDFIFLQEIYRRIKDREHRLSVGASESFDPYKIIYESGYGKVRDSRSALYLSLYRYVSSGLHTYKIRSKDILRERNSLIIRTVLYWAGIYDIKFVQIFIDYNQKILDHIRASSTLRQGVKGKRLFLDGLDWFFKYQDTGRESSGKISRDKLTASIYTLRIFGFDDAPIIPFSEWLLGELELTPIAFQHSRIT
jgi:hypothetical protein